MEITTKNDIRLVGRALRQGWDVPKKKVLEALMEVVERRDPDLLLGAAKLLLDADGIDLKREELELKTKAINDEQRLRLLELARSIPAPELARIASDNGIAVSTDDRGGS